MKTDSGEWRNKKDPTKIASRQYPWVDFMTILEEIEGKAGRLVLETTTWSEFQKHLDEWEFMPERHFDWDKFLKDKK
jgi:hypothetical protein